MPIREPTSSARLRRAATAEVGRLEREHRRLLGRTEALRHEIRELEARISAVTQRIDVLRELAGTHEPSADHANERAVDETRRRLRGPAIREVAIRLLLQRDDRAPIHYRAWLKVLHEAGYTVEGANEAAGVFLSQISRSTLVAKTTSSGTYQLELDAPDRLTSRLARLQEELQDALKRPGRTRPT
jgi:hypothetical protein